MFFRWKSAISKKARNSARLMRACTFWPWIALLVSGSRVILRDEVPEHVAPASYRTWRNLESTNATNDRVNSTFGLDNLTHYAGYINVDPKNDGDLFYWLFEAQPDSSTESAATLPLVIWLQGGPGCSSMLGLFVECGPFRIVNETSVKMNPYGWHKAANMLFVDQPVGTGMSRVKYEAYPSTGKEVAAQFYSFILGFLKRHPEYLAANGTSTRSINLFGESHAGRWIPQFSSYIASQNENHPLIHIRVDGVGIGNGWIHPIIQYDYSSFAHSHGLISIGQQASLQEEYAECIAAIESGNMKANACFLNLNNILTSIQGTTERLNVFDIRQYGNSIHYPPEKPKLMELMNQEFVRNILPGVPSATDLVFAECNSNLNRKLSAEDAVSTLSEISAMLSSGMQVLIFNGQWDMMCNALNTERLLQQLDWPGRENFGSARRISWHISSLDPPAGFVQSGGNLTHVIVRDAGHLVPYNAPEASLDMFTRFIRNRPFEGAAQSIRSSTVLQDDLCDLHNGRTSGVIIGVSVLVGMSSAVIASLLTLLCLRGQHNVVNTEDMDEEDLDDENGDDVVDDWDESTDMIEMAELNRSPKRRAKSTEPG
ncbi:unnamed protein product [Aphanomyces euteiches]